VRSLYVEVVTLLANHFLEPGEGRRFLPRLRPIEREDVHSGREDNDCARGKRSRRRLGLAPVETVRHGVADVVNERGVEEAEEKKKGEHSSKETAASTHARLALRINPERGPAVFL
jgi:hypothetical protein